MKQPLINIEKSRNTILKLGYASVELKSKFKKHLKRRFAVLIQKSRKHTILINNSLLKKTI